MPQSVLYVNQKYKCPNRKYPSETGSVSKDRIWLGVPEDQEARWLYKNHQRSYEKVKIRWMVHDPGEPTRNQWCIKFFRGLIYMSKYPNN